jgi:hypothetical protein
MIDTCSYELNLSLYARIRPLNEDERDHKSDFVNINETFTTLSLTHPYKKHMEENTTFTFDKIFSNLDHQVTKQISNNPFVK